MPQNAIPDFAVSSWSLHRLIGTAYPDQPARPGDGVAVPTWGTGAISIMDFPADVKKHGFDRVEICHFHLKAGDNGFMRELRAALKASGVTLQTLLIDDGDISQASANDRERDMTWIAGWIDAAAELGAQSARVIAGKQKPSPEALQRSVGGLRVLARHGKNAGVRIITENWFDLTPAPGEVHFILDQLEGEIGFLADTGNWTGPDKYDGLAAIFARAERCHAKASFDVNTGLNRDDFGRCMAAAQSAGYQGPLALIFADDGDEWEGLETERAFVRGVWPANA